MFYRLTRDVMKLSENLVISKLNQTKQVKITKIKHINACTNKPTCYNNNYYNCKFTNSNTQICGRLNHVSIAKILTNYLCYSTIVTRTEYFSVCNSA